MAPPPGVLLSQTPAMTAEATKGKVLGGKDPFEALDDAAERATEELQEYNRRVGE